MPSKQYRHRNDQEGAKQKSPKPVTQNTNIVAQQQTHPGAIIKKAGLDPSLLTPRQVLQLEKGYACLRDYANEAKWQAEHVSEVIVEPPTWLK